MTQVGHLKSQDVVQDMHELETYTTSYTVYGIYCHGHCLQKA